MAMSFAREMKDCGQLYPVPLLIVVGERGYTLWNPIDLRIVACFHTREGLLARIKVMARVTWEDTFGRVRHYTFITASKIYTV